MYLGNSYYREWFMCEADEVILRLLFTFIHILDAFFLLIDK